MGKTSRKIKRGMQNTKPRNDEILTPAQYQKIYDDIADRLLSKMMSDVCLVLMDMLENNFGDIMVRATRHENFGKIFKEKLARQTRTQDMTYSKLLDVADLRHINYAA